MLNTQILSSLNCIDFLIIFLSLRILFISFKEGFLTEFLKTLSVFLSFLIGVHFSPIIAEKIKNKFPLRLEGLDSFIFLVITVLSFIIFSLIRKGSRIIFKSEKEKLGLLNRFFSLILGSVRSLFVGCIVICIFLFSEINYLKKITEKAYFYPVLMKFTKSTYKVFYKKFIVKIWPQYPFNEEVEKYEVGKVL